MKVSSSKIFPAMTFFSCPGRVRFSSASPKCWKMYGFVPATTLTTFLRL